MSKRIGVIGCGWLGLPLAKRLISVGNQVSGTTTSVQKMEELANTGIRPFQISLHPDRIEGKISNFLDGLEVLVINVPPRLRKPDADNYVDKIKLLYSEIKISTVSYIIFASSTSVYGKVSNEITEDTIPIPFTNSGKQLLECEQLLNEDPELHTTVIRFGGLIGPNRHPVTTLSSKSGLPNGNDPINLIHLDDCIHIVQTILDNGYWDQTFNAVYPYHPAKREYYAQEALKRNLPAPGYLESSNSPVRGKVSSANFFNKSHKFHTSIVS